MRAIAFLPMYNTPGKKDVTGAFGPEAEKFSQMTGAHVYIVENGRSKERMRAAVRAVVLREHDLEAVAFFCHGWKGGIQLGYRNVDVPAFASDLAVVTAGVCLPNVKIILYCCSTGGDVLTSKSSPGTGNDSFADRLRDEMCKASQHPFTGRVVAHTTVAHCTMNPYVRFFDGMGSRDGGVGGYFPVKPGGSQWQAWRRALKTDFRFKMPFMSVAEIAQALEG